MSVAFFQKYRIIWILVLFISPIRAETAFPDIWDKAIGGVDTVFLEEMTAGEIALALRSGITSVIVATGGIEQNGPNVATGKHNYVLRATTEAIARKHGKMLVSSIVQFVPEGNITPPSGHMNFPGTISISQSTFIALLSDICNSLRQHGFKNIFLIGDSGGNQDGMQFVADSLNSSWWSESEHVFYIPEYYSEDIWSYDYLKKLGYVQKPDLKTSFRNNIHTDLHYESIMSVINPDAVRANMRIKKGKLAIHGVEFKSIAELVEVGKLLTEYRAKITVNAMTNALNGKQNK